ncbi:MAG TPA: hypothetical protein VGQ43_10745 [Candidatus Udaeobacter sp.]|nr:hypothetical protein [Candidatus Udaeobacter sp.]
MSIKFREQWHSGNGDMPSEVDDLWIVCELGRAFLKIKDVSSTFGLTRWCQPPAD